MGPGPESRGYKSAEPRSRLDHDVDVRAGRRTVLRAGVRGDFEFLDGVDGWMNGCGLEERAVVVHAIKRVVAVIAPVAGNSKCLSLDGLCFVTGATHSAR